MSSDTEQQVREIYLRHELRIEIFIHRGVNNNNNLVW